MVDSILTRWLLDSSEAAPGQPAAGSLAERAVGAVRTTSDRDVDETQQLMAQVASGNQEALVELHQRYVNLVYSLALRIAGEPMAAEEITQDVFLKLWRQPRAFDPARGRFTGWLLTITRHLAIDRLRHDGRRPAVLEPRPEAEADPGPSTGTRAEGETRQHLRLALQQLPREQRAVIELAYFGGMSQVEIAEHLRVPLGTVKTRTRLGMEKLRAQWLDTR